MDWDSFDLSALADFIRERFAGHDAEKMIWSFEHALTAARVDPHLLDYLLAAAVCLIAHAECETPRTVLEQVFRRSVTDHEWRHRYAPLLD
jgi:hypothetical protein